MNIDEVKNELLQLESYLLGALEFCENSYTQSLLRHMCKKIHQTRLNITKPKCNNTEHQESEAKEDDLCDLEALLDNLATKKEDNFASFTAFYSENGIPLYKIHFKHQDFEFDNLLDAKKWLKLLDK